MCTNALYRLVDVALVYTTILLRILYAICVYTTTLLEIVFVFKCTLVFSRIRVRQMGVYYYSAHLVSLARVYTRLCTLDGVYRFC